MPVFDEETFGPVAAVIRAATTPSAIELANHSRFGLGASVWTRDAARGEAVAAQRLQAGAVFVNGIVRSDPRLPFGGVKRSGYGRELGAVRPPRVRQHQDRLRPLSFRTAAPASSSRSCPGSGTGSTRSSSSLSAPNVTGSWWLPVPPPLKVTW